MQKYTARSQEVCIISHNNMDGKRCVERLRAGAGACDNLHADCADDVMGWLVSQNTSDRWCRPQYVNGTLYAHCKTRDMVDEKARLKADFRRESRKRDEPR